MWTLPYDTTFTIRQIEKPLAEMLARAGGGRCTCDPERISVHITRGIKVERDRRGSKTGIGVYNVFNGEHARATVVEERLGNVSYWDRYAAYWVGALAPCEVFVVRQGHTATVYVHQLWLDDLMRGELEVARDAILQAPEGVPPVARKIAKELLPYGYGLFLALIQKERSL